MGNDFVDDVVCLHNEGNWKEILKLSDKYDDSVTRKLLWVWISEENLFFLKRVLDEFVIKTIVSVGCGCGLLEWILHKYCGKNIYLKYNGENAYYLKRVFAR